MIEAYARYEHLLATSQLVFAMLGMGALLAPRDFALVLRRPRAFALGLAIQLGVVPALAAGLGWALPVAAGIAAGLVLVASVPCGTISNLLVYLGRGHVALSISLTAVTTVGALVTTPALLRLCLGASLPEFEMPVWAVAREIAVALLVPLAAGMTLGARLPQGKEVFSHWCIRTSLGFMALIALGAAASGRLDPRAFGIWGLFAMLAFGCAVQTAAWLGSRAAALHPADRLALLATASMRNTNLAVMVKAIVFPAAAARVDPIGDGMLFTALLYGGFGLLVVAPTVLWHRLRPAVAPPPEA